VVLGANQRKPSPVQTSHETWTRDGTGKSGEGNGRRNAEQYSQAGGFQTMKKYLIIVEKTDTGYSAFSPDVPGCGSTGDTKEEVERNIQEAIEFHLEGLREEGYEISEPWTYSSYIDIAA
jgi:predicted RNase H-like HicB family nuclease